MLYVFDASFVAAQIIPGQKNAQTEALYRKIKDGDEKYAPQLFWYEITNIFTTLLRRQRYSREEVKEFFRPLSAIRLSCDSSSGPAYSEKLLRLSIDYRLSAYDAAYLELADRKKAVLCTFDKALQTAAEKLGVGVLN